MKRLPIFLAIGLACLIACNPQTTSTPPAEQPKQDTIAGTPGPPPPTPTGDMEMFTNMEQIEYTVPIPKDFKHDDARSDERTKHVFVKKGKPEQDIEVKGVYYSGEAMSLEKFFEGYYTEEDEAEGKIIQQKGLIKAKGLFWAKGYYSNLIYESRFAEIVWKRGDEIVKYSVNYAVQDTVLWNSRMTLIMDTKQ